MDAIQHGLSLCLALINANPHRNLSRLIAVNRAFNSIQVRADFKRNPSSLRNV